MSCGRLMGITVRSGWIVGLQAWYRVKKKRRSQASDGTTRLVSGDALVIVPNHIAAGFRSLTWKELSVMDYSNLRSGPASKNLKVSSCYYCIANTLPRSTASPHGSDYSYCRQQPWNNRDLETSKQGFRHNSRTNRSDGIPSVGPKTPCCVISSAPELALEGSLRRSVGALLGRLGPANVTGATERVLFICPVFRIPAARAMLGVSRAGRRNSQESSRLAVAGDPAKHTDNRARLSLCSAVSRKGSKES